MDDVQNLEQGLPNTNSSQIKQGRGKSNKNQQTRHFYGKWHRTSVPQNFSQESRFSNVISMWSAKTYHVWGWSLALASPWWFCALCCQIKKLCTGERVFHVFGLIVAENQNPRDQSIKSCACQCSRSLDRLEDLTRNKETYQNPREITLK